MSTANSSEYEYGSFIIASGTIDYDVKNSWWLFNKYDSYAYCRITTTADVSIKFNDTNNDAVDMTRSENGNLVFSSESWAPIRPIKNLYITNDWANNATVWILLCDRKNAIFKR